MKLKVTHIKKHQKSIKIFLGYPKNMINRIHKLLLNSVEIKSVIYELGDEA